MIVLVSSSKHALFRYLYALHNFVVQNRTLRVRNCILRMQKTTLDYASTAHSVYRKLPVTLDYEVVELRKVIKCRNYQ